MKKFSKILTLLLSLVVIVTAFTIIALADTTEAATLQPSRTGGYDFNTGEPGTIFHNTTDKTTGASTKDGIWNYADADNGNVYVVAEWENGSGTAGDNWDPSTVSNYKTHNLQNYPTFAFDFDVMSLVNGTYDYSSVRMDLYGATSYHGHRLSQGHSFSISALSLPKTVNEWNHVTLMLRYNGNGTFTAIGYVNGVETYTETVDYRGGETDATKFSGSATQVKDAGIYNWEDLLDENGELKHTDIRVAYLSIYPVYKSSSERIGFDNLNFTYFPASYEPADIATYYYNDSYEMPYGVTVAKIGDAVYDDVNEAIDAAENGATVNLVTNAKDVLLINKEILVDTNVYVDGVASGSFYTFDYTSTAGFIATETAEGSGIYSFAKAANAVDVIWDEACEDENCDCYAQYGGHALTQSTVVVLGDTPMYPAETPEFEMANDYTQKFFLGWSYTKGGKAVDLAAVTQDDVDAGTIKLYPVYKTVQYKIVVISSSGTHTYYVEEDFAAAVNAATSGATIKLLADVYTECGPISINRHLTFDINGYTLKRCYVYGNVYEATPDGEGGYVCDTTGTPTTIAGSNYFFTVSSGKTFTFTSTGNGGAIYNLDMKADTWMYDGEIVKRTVGAVSSNKLMSSNASNTTLNINGGLDLYMYGLWTQDYKSSTNHTINIDNVNFYKIHDNGTVSSSGMVNYVISMMNTNSSEINISNSKFFFPYESAGFLGLGTNASSPTSVEEGDFAKVRVTNCDIVKASAANSISLTNYRGTEGTTDVKFIDCRIYDMYTNGSEMTMEQGTLYRDAQYDSQNASKPPISDGWEKKTVKVSRTYEMLTSYAFTANTDSEINTVNFEFETTDVTLTFDAIATKAFTATWMNGEETYATTTVYPGSNENVLPKLTKELEGDLYRDILYQWIDANGRVADDVLNSVTDWTVEGFTFNAAESVGGVTKYAPVLKDAQLSLSYVSQFHQHFYLPVVEGMERPTITGYKPSSLGTVIINRQQYYLYTFWEAANSILNTNTITVNYTIDGVDYTAKVDVSALIYADLILSNQSYYAAEAESVANMVRYAYECYKITSSDATVAANLEKYTPKITELIGTVAADGSTTGGKFNLNAYTTNFGEVAESDIDSYGAYIHSMGFGIVGTSGRTMVILNKEATDAGVTIYFNGSIGRTSTTTIKNTDEEDVTVTVFFVDNQKVYNAIGKINITIKVSEEESYSTSYSLPQYITEVSEQSPEANINVAKAMYDFGVAAKAYVEGLSDY